MAKISVIVPVYKVESYLKQNVDSILGQTFKDFELILVDDGSPDKCGEMCDEYAANDSRVRVIHQKNGGLSAARNTGIEHVLAHSVSQYIAFIDSDDIVAPDYLECLYTAMNEDVDVTCVKPIIAAEFTATSFDPGLIKHTNINPEQYWCRQGFLPMTAWGKLYQKKLFDTIRYPVGKVHEDEFVTHELVFARPKIAFIDAIKYGYRSRPGSIMDDDRPDRILTCIDALQKQICFFKDKGLRAAETTIAKRQCLLYATVIPVIKASELFDILKKIIHEYNFSALDAVEAYKLLHPISWRLRWCLAYARKEGILHMISTTAQLALKKL